MYLPKSKYKGNLYAQAGEYVYASDKTPYSGFYFQTYEGRYFTGKEPSASSKEILVAPDDVSAINASPARQPAAVTRYDLIRNNTKEFKLKSTLPVEIFYPKPVPADYEKGFITRYFAREKNTGIIKEIAGEVYQAIKRQDPTYYYPNYTVVKFPWIITAPLSDTIVGGYKVPGASSLNNKAINDAEKVLPGISEYLTDLTQFA